MCPVSLTMNQQNEIRKDWYTKGEIFTTVLTNQSTSNSSNLQNKPFEKLFCASNYNHYETSLTSLVEQGCVSDRTKPPTLANRVRLLGHYRFNSISKKLESTWIYSAIHNFFTLSLMKLANAHLLGTRHLHILQQLQNAILARNQNRADAVHHNLILQDV